MCCMVAWELKLFLCFIEDGVVSLHFCVAWEMRLLHCFFTDVVGPLDLFLMAKSEIKTC